MFWKLWIDDQWSEPDMIFRRPPIGFITAKNSKEAKALVQMYGMPEFISFDHDYGKSSTGEEDNAIIFLNWLIENYYDYNVPAYAVHSANPVGKANIISKMESWKKSKGL